MNLLEQQKVIIHLDGELDMELSSQLYERIYSLSKSPSLVLLDFSTLDTIQISSSEYLPRVFALADHENITMGMCNLQLELQPQIQIFCKDHSVPIFLSLDAAKEELEKIPLTTSKPETHFTTEPIVIPDSLLYEPKIIRCLSCNVKLRIKAPGSYQCPACKFKFTALDSMEIIPKKKH
jgi:anti-anti-sigma regulatory factor